MIFSLRSKTFASLRYFFNHDLCFSCHLFNLFVLLILAIKYGSDYALDYHNDRKSTDGNEKNYLYGLLDIVDHQIEHY